MFGSVPGRRFVPALGLWFTLTAAVHAQRFEHLAVGPGGPKSTVPLKSLVLHPEAAPIPALKYYLLPEMRDLKPGNAALLYQRAHSPEWWSAFYRDPKFYEKINDWLQPPLKKMPRDKIFLPSGPMKEIDLAARREYCDWEMGPRLRTDGIGLLLPDVQGFRTFGNFVALRSRLEMLDGQFDKAVVSFQTGFALGRHVGDAPTLINSLVGIAIAGNMANQVEEFVQLAGAPNLYWALADLPRPLIDMRRALQGEKIMVEGMFPDIREALNDPKFPPLSNATVKKALDNLMQVGEGASRLLITLGAARIHPEAKKYFLARGRTAEHLETIPVVQLALMYNLALYDEFFDESYKWNNFPFWQALPEMKKAAAQFSKLRKEKYEAGFLAGALLPALENVLFAKARLQRRLAILATIEGLRMHAASGEGKFPASLDDLRYPVPLDPITGKAFTYSLTDGKALLVAQPPPGEEASERNSLRYELTLAPRK